MRFPNATKGVKRVFLAEILAMIAALIIAVGSIVAPGAAQVLEDGAEAAASVPAVYVILMACASLLGIVAFIVNIIGINNAKADDDNFKIALLCALLGIVLSVVVAFFQNNVDVTRRLNSAITIDQLLTSFFVLTGLMSLASQLEDSATEKKARTSRTWLIGAFIASLISGNVVVILAKNGSGAVIALGLVNIVVQAVTFIIYLRALGAGRSMLSNN